MAKFVDLTGQRFGRWTAVRLHTAAKDNPKGPISLWLCRCDCGTEKAVVGTSLRNGDSKSCGCLKKELVAAPRPHRRVTKQHTEERLSAWFKKWRSKNNLELRTYRQNDRARSLGVNGRFTPDEFRARLEEFDHRCAYCLERHENLEVDHFRPLSKGGENSIENIVPACASCNAIKGNKLVFEWAKLFAI